MAALELKRRDALLGIGAGIAGAAVTGLGLGVRHCSRQLGSRTVSGTIVGGDAKLGHRLREGFRPGPSTKRDVPVVIVGGGMAGLSAAWTFERAGFRDFVVLELEPQAGGTSRSGENEVSPYPWAAHYVPVPDLANRPLVKILDEIGAVERRDEQGRPVWAEEILCREPQERIFYRDRWYEGLYPRAGASAADIQELLAFEADMRRWSHWRDDKGRPGFALPRMRGSSHAEMVALDRISMAEYLDSTGLRGARLHWFVEYGMRDDFGSTLARTSAWAGIHYHASRFESETGPPAEFLTWPEGNGRIVRHLTEMAGQRVRPFSLVTEIAPVPDGVLVSYFDALERKAVQVRAEHAILAAPRFLWPFLVTPWREHPPAFAQSVPYVPWVVANLTLSGRPEERGYPLAWDNVLYDSDALGFVVATHQTGKDTGPTVFTWYRPFVEDDLRAAREKMLALSWEGWVDLILADLHRPYPHLAELLRRVDVYLWGHAMVRPEPGSLFAPSLAEAAHPLGRLHFAHTDLSGMALFEEAQYHGIRAAEEVLRARRATFASWLD